MNIEDLSLPHDNVKCGPSLVHLGVVEKIMRD
jgi:hypothetical protein